MYIKLKRHIGAYAAGTVHAVVGTVSKSSCPDAPTHYILKSGVHIAVPDATVEGETEARPQAELYAALRAERQDVLERLERLCRALYDGKLDGVDAETLVLIRAQRDIMTDYVDVLDERISRLKEKV